MERLLYVIKRLENIDVYDVNEDSLVSTKERNKVKASYGAIDLTATFYR